jgi:hypothetical protein
VQVLPSGDLVGMVNLMVAIPVTRPLNVQDGPPWKP